MPTYDYKCPDCGIQKEIFHGIKETPTISCTCGSEMKKMVSKNVSFVLKGADWSGKNIKEKGYRLRRRKEIGKKMVENHNIPQIQPNYKGEVCNSWKEAEQLAKADGADINTYQKQVSALETQQNKIKEKVEKLKKGEE